MFNKVTDNVAMPLSDFIAEYNTTPFELIDGERIVLVPGIARHIETIQAIFIMLKSFVDEHDLGRVYSEAPFVLEYKPDWVRGSRVPDVMFYQQARFDTYIDNTPDWQDKPYILVPDLVIEVISPNDRYTDINKKVRHYLEDGVELIWLIDPQERNAVAHTDERTTIYNTDDRINAGDVVPDFAFRVTDILP